MPTPNPISITMFRCIMFRIASNRWRLWRMKLYFRYEIVFIRFACGYGKKEEGSRNDTMNKGNLSQGNAQHKKERGIER